MSEELRTCGECARIACVEWACVWACTSKAESVNGTFVRPEWEACGGFEERGES